MKRNRPIACALSSCLLVLLGLLLTSLFAQDKTNQFSPEIEKQIKGILAAKYPYDTDSPGLAKRYRTLFQSVGPQGIRQLQSYPHTGIAIQAAWEEFTLTVPQKGEKPDREKLSWFLGFVEGRAHLQIPQWWADSLLNSGVQFNWIAIKPGNPRCIIHPALPKEALYHKVGLDFVKAPKNTTLKKEGDKIRMSIGNESVLIPIDLLDKFDNGEFICNVSGLMTPRRCFLAVHNDTGGKYTITCVDRMSGKVIWQNETMDIWWAAGSGMAMMWVTVTEQNGLVVSFASNSTGAHIEAFQLEDGKNAFRFSSTF
jgi:hypothetical protein